MTEHLPTSKSVNIPRRFVPVRNGTAFSGMKQLGDSSTWDDELEPYVRWSDYERLTAALATCQTYDYRTLVDEVERLRAALDEAIEFIAQDWPGLAENMRRKHLPAETIGDDLEGGR